MQQSLHDDVERSNTTEVISPFNPAVPVLSRVGEWIWSKQKRVNQEGET
jgi:hypothetical protein